MLPAFQDDVDNLNQSPYSLLGQYTDIRFGSPMVKLIHTNIQENKMLHLWEFGPLFC